MLSPCRKVLRVNLKTPEIDVLYPFGIEWLFKMKSRYYIELIVVHELIISLHYTDEIINFAKCNTPISFPLWTSVEWAFQDPIQFGECAI